MNKRNPLNLPSENDPLDAVSFVKDMKAPALRTLVKNLWKNVQDLAEALDDSRPDISSILDKILDGAKWKEDSLDDRKYFGHYKGFIIQWDSKEKTFTLMDGSYKAIENPLKGMPRTEILKKLIKKAKG